MESSTKLYRRVWWILFYRCKLEDILVKMWKVLTISSYIFWLGNPERERQNQLSSTFVHFLFVIFVIDVWFLWMLWFCDFLVLSCPLLLQRLARQVQDLSKLPAKVMMSSSFQKWTCPPLQLQPNLLKVTFCSSGTKTKNTELHYSLGPSCNRIIALPAHFWK